MDASLSSLSNGASSALSDAALRWLCCGHSSHPGWCRKLSSRSPASPSARDSAPRRRRSTASSQLQSSGPTRTACTRPCPSAAGTRPPSRACTRCCPVWAGTSQCRSHRTWHFPSSRLAPRSTPCGLVGARRAGSALAAALLRLDEAGRAELARRIGCFILEASLRARAALQATRLRLEAHHAAARSVCELRTSTCALSATVELGSDRVAELQLDDKASVLWHREADVIEPLSRILGSGGNTVAAMAGGEKPRRELSVVTLTRQRVIDRQIVHVAGGEGNKSRLVDDSLRQRWVAR
eukprot:7378306-Prymnesium_polylepis.3